ncbi:SDR family oxidoreductase [Halomonas sp. HP20-15]|uniref:SDR family NAD(P)-dependent oxidoreductase n=1 Tax=Halomonas sp. HP20-15 TaxID=3085901 RepID=UPI002981AF25|nr:SDR family oxidoreductase [Halomonas sp. HP20-15]MDW5378034.1 SDR family oxidoreductase [Halomonas sp. HP20-15]
MSNQWTPDLRGECAIITGGTRNIGLAIAGALHACGAGVCLVGASDHQALADALKALGGESDRVTGLLASVAEEISVDGIFTHAEKRLGAVSILVNGAAERPHSPFLSISRQEWDAVVGVILTGAFLTSQRLFRNLPEARQGAIVNLGGLSAHRPAVERPHVIAAKAGLVGLTRALAEEGLGRVRVNCVVPGAIDTARKPGQSVPHQVEKGPYRALGTSETVARAVLPFADPRESYVTGQTLHVNGGRFMP